MISSKWLNSSIWPTDETLTGITTPSQGGPESNDNEDLVWSGLVLWQINHCRLFHAKSFLYIYIKYMISKHILEITFLNDAELIFLHTVK